MITMRVTCDSCGTYIEVEGWWSDPPLQPQARCGRCIKRRGPLVRESTESVRLPRH